MTHADAKFAFSLDLKQIFLPTFLKCQTYPNINILQWWQQNESALLCWVAAACKFFLAQPSSEKNLSSIPSSKVVTRLHLMLQYNIC